MGGLDRRIPRGPNVALAEHTLTSATQNTHQQWQIGVGLRLTQRVARATRKISRTFLVIELGVNGF